MKSVAMEPEEKGGLELIVLWSYLKQLHNEWTRDL